MKHYVAPRLDVELTVPDTMISSYVSCPACSGYDADYSRDAGKEGYTPGMWTDGNTWFYCYAQ